MKKLNQFSGDDFLSQKIFENIENVDLNDLDEGFFSTLLGGAAGFLVGPSVGKAIAKVLGVEKGLLFDLLTSKIVTTALGIAVSQSLDSKTPQIVATNNTTTKK